MYYGRPDFADPMWETIFREHRWGGCVITRSDPEQRDYAIAPEQEVHPGRAEKADDDLPF